MSSFYRLGRSAGATVLQEWAGSDRPPEGFGRGWRQGREGVAGAGTGTETEPRPDEPTAVCEAVVGHFGEQDKPLPPTSRARYF